MTRIRVPSKHIRWTNPPRGAGAMAHHSLEERRGGEVVKIPGRWQRRRLRSFAAGRAAPDPASVLGGCPILSRYWEMAKFGQNISGAAEGRRSQRKDPEPEHP